MDVEVVIMVCQCLVLDVSYFKRRAVVHDLRVTMITAVATVMATVVTVSMKIGLTFSRWSVRIVQR